MTDSGKYFGITAEEVAYVRKQLGTNEEDIKTAVTSLREWLRLQPHLPDAVDDSLIERMYINCKCSMERVKLGLDAYFSLKNRIPEFLMNRDARGTDIQFAMEHIKMMTMPRLTKDAYRVHVITAVDEDSMNIIWAPYGKILSIAMEVMFVEDYSIGDVCIIDMANVNAGHVVRADINIIRNLELCYKTAYCRRLKGLHFVNASKIMDSAMKIVKMALSEKLQKRVFVHLPGSTSLFDHVQRDCLPDELGGTAGPADKLASMADIGKYLVITAEEVAYVRRQLGTNEEDIKVAVTSLREWLRLQPHLPDAVDDSLIERMYINSKCSMEKVKLGLDAYFSLKHRFPELLMNRDFGESDFQFAKKHLKMMVMPRLTKDAYRVHVWTAVDEDSTNVIWPLYGKILTTRLEIMLVEDYSLGDVGIIDLANVNAGHIVRADINLVRNIEVCYQTAYRRRLKGLHLVNASKIIHSVMKIVKMALSEKLQKRVFAHLPGSTTLFDYVQRDCVPDELGGTAGPADNFAYKVREMVNSEWLLEKDKYMSDEIKRPADNHYGDIYGIAGSFKKLSVD